MSTKTQNEPLAIFATIAEEQLGTNLRATVATTVPNLSAEQLYQ